MSDYIEREAALKSVNRNYPNPNAMCAALVTIPAADVRPVVRGRWIEHGEPNERGDYEPWYWKCSICGAIAGHGEYNYCPNCGCAMEKEQ